MTDIADQHADFKDAVRRAEEAAGITRDSVGNEVYADEGTPAVPVELEGAVPVQASDQPLTPAEPVVPVTEQTATSQEQQPVAPAAPQTVEELQAELAAAQARIEEQKTMIGRQSAEVGDARSRMDDLESRLAAVQAAQAQPVTPAAPAIQITQELIETNPALAAQAAFDQKNQAALEAAWNAWDAEGDGTAKLWLAERRAEQRESVLQAQIAATQQELQQVKEPLQQRDAELQANQAWKEAFDEVKVTRPDFMENVERLLVEVAPQYPDIANVLSTGDGKAKAQALAALYALDKMGNPQAMQQQLAQAAQEAEEEAAAARAAAGVVTGQTTAGQPAEQKTTEELEADAYINRQRGKPTLASGWTGRS